MITFFYEMARNLKRNKKSYWTLVYKINKLLLNILYPLCQRGKKGIGIDSKSRIIVSLTTFPDRIDLVWITISSLMQQTMKPCKIILWLAEEQFPDKKLPKSLVSLQKRGLDIRYCDDLKPHKKYFYTMQKYPEYFIVTADDDIFYPENHIEQLWKGQEKYPNAIICHWNHKIRVDKNRNFYPYNEWKDDEKRIPSLLNLAVGCNGVLYPPHCLSEKAFQKEVVQKYALYTDDLWLKCMEVLKNCEVVNCNETTLIYYSILKAQKVGLWKLNTGQEQNNDKVWLKLMELYPDVEKKLRSVAE